MVLAALVTGTTVGFVVAYQPLVAVGLVIAPLVAALALYRLPIAVALWIPLMFIEGISGSRLAPELFGLFVGIGWVAALRIGSLRGSLDGARGLVVALCALLTWFALSLLWAYDVSTAAGYAWYFAEVAIFLVIIATVPRDASTVRLFFAMFVVGAVVSVAIGVGGVLRGDAAVEQGSRLQGGAGDPNYFAAALMPALALTIGMSRAATTRAGRYWSLAAALPLIFGVAASQSRGALVAAAVMAIVAIVVFPRERWAILLCVCAVVSVGATYFVMDPGAWNRITHDKYGGSGREDLWRVGTRIARDHPILGVGLDNFGVVSPSYVREPGSLSYVSGILRGQEPHNVYLGLLVEVGPLGLLLFLARADHLPASCVAGLAALSAGGHERHVRALTRRARRAVRRTHHVVLPSEPRRQAAVGADGADRRVFRGFAPRRRPHAVSRAAVPSMRAAVPSLRSSQEQDGCDDRAAGLCRGRRGRGCGLAGGQGRRLARRTQLQPYLDSPLPAVRDPERQVPGPTRSLRRPASIRPRAGGPIPPAVRSTDASRRIRHSLATRRRSCARLTSWGPPQQLLAGHADTSSDYFHPLYWSRPGDPRFTIHCTRYGRCPIEGHRIRIPGAARPAAGDDGHMAVIDSSTGFEYDFWQVRQKPRGGGTLVVSYGGRTRIAGQGLGSNATAAWFGLAAGVVRAEEMEAGRIDHALFAAIKCASGRSVYPAQAGTTGSRCSNFGLPGSDAPPMGARIWLDLSPEQIGRLRIPRWRKTILEALNRYGMIVGDTTSGNGAWGLVAESGSSYTSFGERDAWSAFAAKVARRSSGRYGLELDGGVDWSRHLHVVQPCVSRGNC